MLAAPDRAVVADPRLRTAFTRMVREALRQGARGPLLDLQLAGEAWQIRPTPTPVPVHLWHGQDDPDSPISAARYLAARLPGAELHTYPGEAHVSVFVHHAANILSDLAQPTAQRIPPPTQGD
jgi:pimeloyl-ACP methyl ester carboxylesterase